jgi:hypothetical protein
VRFGACGTHGLREHARVNGHNARQVMVIS